MVDEVNLGLLNIWDLPFFILTVVAMICPLVSTLLIYKIYKILKRYSYEKKRDSDDGNNISGE